MAGTYLRVLPTPTAVDECWALDLFARPGIGATRAAQMFTSAKYRRFGPPRVALCEALATAAADIAMFSGWPSDLSVVPVPSSSPLVRTLGEAVARALGRPMLDVLTSSGRSKVKNIDWRDRSTADRSDLALLGGVRCPATVLLVDDLVESGSTLAAAASILRRAGATTVYAMTAVHLHRNSGAVSHP